MAALGKIELKADKYFTNTRITICANKDCPFNNSPRGDRNCNLKDVVINEDGSCGKDKRGLGYGNLDNRPQG